MRIYASRIPCTVLIIALAATAGACGGDAAAPTQSPTAAPTAAPPSAPTAAAGQQAATGRSTIDAMNAALSVSVTEKGFEARDEASGRTVDAITFLVAFENLGDQDLTSVAGTMRFVATSGATLKEVPLAYEGPIETGRKVYWLARAPFDPALDGDTALRDIDLSSIAAVWAPERYTFANGEALSNDG